VHDGSAAQAAKLRMGDSVRLVRIHASKADDQETTKRFPPGWGSGQSASLEENEERFPPHVGVSLCELAGFFLHAALDCVLLADTVLDRKLSHVFVIFIEQKCGPHMEQKCPSLAPSCGKSFIVKLTRGFRVEAQVELIFPAKLEPGMTWASSR
jgi:hypothetical protein